jgi:hypothetical protein
MKFLSPVFEEEEHRVLPKGTILPVTEKGVEKWSTFSVVTKVCISESHRPVRG